MAYDDRQPPHPPQVPRKAPDEAPGWFDVPRNVRRLKILACVLVLGLLALDFVLHYHVHLGGEQIPGFYTLFGLLASFLLIAVAKLGGLPLKRKAGDHE